LEACEAGLLKAHAKTISHAKLDPALVRAAVSDEAARDELVALTRTARDCDVQIIALAVDSAEVLPILCAAGVDHVQGHLVSTPHEQLVYPGFQHVEPAVTEAGAETDAEIDSDAGAGEVEAASDR
jgi:EAL domain-containing protein (putative c-di-GMP-specific phosphodiesterase class I)